MEKDVIIFDIIKRLIYEKVLKLFTQFIVVALAYTNPMKWFNTLYFKRLFHNSYFVNKHHHHKRYQIPEAYVSLFVSKVFRYVI